MIQRPPGITDHEWEAMLQYIAIMAAWERAQYQAAFDRFANVDIWPEDKPKPSPNAVEFVSRDEAILIWRAGIDAILAEGA